MRVYLAAAYERHEEMRGVRDLLTAFGHEITSHWIDVAITVPRETPGKLDSNADSLAQHARVDLADVDNAEAIILFTGGGRGGYHTEYGFALGRGKYLIIVGTREHVFHSLAAEWYPGWTGLVMAITGRPLPDGRLSALYFLHPDPAHATDEMPAVMTSGAPAGPGHATEEIPMLHGAPADPGPETQWWPFTPANSRDARDIAAKLGVPQREDS